MKQRLDFWRSICTLGVAGLLATGTSAWGADKGPALLDTVPTARQFDVLPLNAVTSAEVEAVDRDAVALEDDQRNEAGLPPRYAIPNEVFFTPDNSGTWEKLPDGTMLWRLRVIAPEATSVNLGFTRYAMPEGGRLMIYTPDYQQTVRPFTARDNAAHGELWTPALPGGEMVVEVTIPADKVGELGLELTSINYGYRGFWDVPELPEALSGSCNVDVICPEGDDWRLDIPAIGVISTGGSTFCTGFMVNNTAQDLKPYFMTANHCGISSGNAASLVVYWNYENSTCRTPGSPASGGPGDGLLNQFQSGSFFRSSYSTSDFTLVELDEDPNPAWNISFAGWDRSGAEATTAIGIHHPNTDEKRISFEYQSTQTTSYLGTTVPGNGSHVRIIDWDLGTTEPGSSGSPVFNQDHRVIGQLHGGYAACGNNDSDWYGKFSVSWTGGGSSSSRLSDWLDTGNTGLMAVDTVSLATLCSDAGEVKLDAGKYGCSGMVTVELVDCGLNLSPTALDTATMVISSDSEPSGETMILTEKFLDSGRFEGVMPLGAVNAPGVLLVSAGDTISATYIDADDGQGGTNIAVVETAPVDCTPPAISNVQLVDLGPRDVTISFDTDELSSGRVRYGLSCGVLNGSAEDTTYSNAPQVTVSGLQDNQTYYYAVEATDEAENTGSDNNGGACYTFTTPEVPDFFTEEYGASDNDLDNKLITFSPNGTIDFYSYCVEPISALPTDPTGGTGLSLGDDAFATVTLTGGASVSLYGVSYTTFYVGSNGYITFNSGDSDYTETLAEHFNRPRISALYDDLSPNQAGAVSWKQLADRVVVTWLGVTEYNALNSNTFQIEMLFDGEIHLAYTQIAAVDGIAGLSEGLGLSPDYNEMDLSAGGNCGAQPPVAPIGTWAMTKSRYISFSPNNGADPVNFQVEMLAGPGSPGMVGWVDVPDGNGIARLRSTPITPAPLWAEAVIHIGDCAIVPGAQYGIRATFDGTNFSDEYGVSTTPQPSDGRLWGDTVGSFDSGTQTWNPPNGTVNGFDIVAVLERFANDPSAPHMTWVDVNPQIPDKVANGTDVLQVVNAFSQGPYPFVTPDNCP
ncbi:MAG: trypsin-like peptidase domain-containing protein [Phycisphaerae bacterium]|nr:trypsin-like peptidase domain-containing protein [Phycisphaerae bacterium]